jgi:hypothetical protein
MAYLHENLDFAHYSALMFVFFQRSTLLSYQTFGGLIRQLVMLQKFGKLKGAKVLK